MSSLVLLDINLSTIRSFLERVAKSVNSDYSQIMCRVEDGEFADDEELSALDEPMMVDDIAVRATLGELNALVDWELQHVARVPLAQEQMSKKVRHPKLVWDLNRNELVRLIDDYYRISVKALPCFNDIEEIRRAVNAYKHRGGFKDLRRDTDWTRFPEKFHLDREKALAHVQNKCERRRMGETTVGETAL